MKKVFLTLTIMVFGALFLASAKEQTQPLKQQTELFAHSTNFP